MFNCSFVLEKSYMTCLGDDALEGVVMDYSSQWVRVAVPQSLAGHIQGQPWRLDQYANTTAHERCVLTAYLCCIWTFPSTQNKKKFSAIRRHNLCAKERQPTIAAL